MSQYRQLVRYSASVLSDPSPVIREQESRMAAAAAELRFETAGKIKQYIDQLKQLHKGPTRHVRRMQDFAFVSIQRGPRPSSAKVFLVTPGGIEEILALLGETIAPGQVLRVALERAGEREKAVSDATAAERLGVGASHVFSGKSGGVFLNLETLDEESITRAYRHLQKQPDPEAVEGEGVVKELQSL